MEEFVHTRAFLLARLLQCAEYCFELLKRAPIWCFIDFLRCMDPHDKALYNVFTDEKGIFTAYIYSCNH